MKTAKELMKDLNVRDDWKHLKLWNWANDYETKATEWNNIMPPVSDDRYVYIHIYRAVYEAIDSLPDNPCNWLCCAVSHELSRERKTMDGILEEFK